LLVKTTVNSKTFTGRWCTGEFGHHNTITMMDKMFTKSVAFDLFEAVFDHNPRRANDTKFLQQMCKHGRQALEYQLLVATSGFILFRHKTWVGAHHQVKVF